MKKEDSEKKELEAYQGFMDSVFGGDFVDPEKQHCRNCNFYNTERKLCRERKVIVEPDTPSCKMWGAIPSFERKNR